MASSVWAVARNAIPWTNKTAMIRRVATRTTPLCSFTVCVIRRVISGLLRLSLNPLDSDPRRLFMPERKQGVCQAPPCNKVIDLEGETGLWRGGGRERERKKTSHNVRGSIEAGLFVREDVVQAVGFDLAIQGPLRNPQETGGGGLVPIDLSHGGQQGLALDHLHGGPDRKGQRAF